MSKANLVIMDELNSQLCQMRNAVLVASEEDKPVILKIIQDLEELIQHSTLVISNPVTAAEDQTATEGSYPSGPGQDDDDEFMKFQREIADLEKATKTEAETETDGNVDEIGGESGESSNQDTAEEQNIESELEALQGMKCKAPFEASWGQIGYYNAVVTGVEKDNESEKDSIELIKVRVLFSQPISKGMLPCPFYFENSCRFSDDSCKFSHGEVVSLSLLKEYQEPDHKKVIPGSNVLAKFTDGIWYKAKILKISDDGECDIRYDKYKENSTVPMHDTCPVDDDLYTKSLSESESDSNSITSDENDDNEEEIQEYSNMFFLKVNSTSVLGEWEKHTNGFGSKIMAKMGYIIGTGLGKNAEGRIEPIDAYVLPPGISLDTCMELKEKAGDTNLFSAAKKLRKEKKKQIAKTKRDEEKLKKDHSVFEFLNKSLGMSKSNKNQKKNQNIVKQSSELNKDTSQTLNRKLYNIGEEVRETSKKIESIKASIKRHERDPKTAEQMKQKLQYLENHLIELKKSEVNVSSAVKSRNDLKKVTIF